MARHDGALSPRAARGSCPSTRASGCSAAGTAAMRGTPQQGPGRVVAREPIYAAAVVHGAAHGRAARALPAQSAAHAHLPLAPAVGVGQGPLRLYENVEHVFSTFAGANNINICSNICRGVLGGARRRRTGAGQGGDEEVAHGELRRYGGARSVTRSASQQPPNRFFREAMRMGRWFPVWASD